jgi:hypothetical protein
MIELKTYALTDKSRSMFELCKGALAKKVADIPEARNVIDMYTAVEDPYQMTPELCKTRYSDKYVTDVNNIITEIMLQDEPEKFVESFDQLVSITD